MSNTSPQAASSGALPARHAATLANFDKLPDSAGARLPVVAALFGIGTATVWRWSRNGTLPKPTRRGRVTFWPVGALRRVLAGKGA